MQTTTRRPNHAATPARWQAAAQRAVAEQIQIRQLQSTGEWIATSGSDTNLAYLVAVTGAIAHGCDCLAGLNGDPVCKHRAAYYLSIGALSLDAALEVSRDGRWIACAVCGGQGAVEGAARRRHTCTACNGRGRFPHVKRAA